MRGDEFGCTSELTEALKFHDIGLTPDLLDECSLSSWPSNRRFGRRSTKDRSNCPPTRVLDDKKDTSEDDTEQEADDKVPPERLVSHYRLLRTWQTARYAPK